DPLWQRSARPLGGLPRAGQSHGNRQIPVLDVPRMKTPTVALVLLFAVPLTAQHPRPQPRPGPSVQPKLPAATIQIVPPPRPLPAGQNFLLTVDSNMFDGNGQEMVNTEPSRPSVPYNLMNTPVITKIDPISPADDLSALIEKVRAAAAAGRVDSAS